MLQIVLMKRRRMNKSLSLKIEKDFHPLFKTILKNKLLLSIKKAMPENQLNPTQLEEQAKVKANG